MVKYLKKENSACRQSYPEHTFKLNYSKNLSWRNYWNGAYGWSLECFPQDKHHLSLHKAFILFLYINLLSAQFLKLLLCFCKKTEYLRMKGVLDSIELPMLRRVDYIRESLTNLESHTFKAMQCRQYLRWVAYGCPDSLLS